MENKVVILVGDVGDYLSEAAKELDSTATLLTQDNSDNLKAGIYYTSLGDFSNLNSFIRLLEKANTLIYQPPTQWSDVDQNGFSYMQEWTEFYLLYCQSRAEVLEIQNIQTDDIKSMLELSDYRKSEQPQLWSVGCSITHGVGVLPSERYGQLIADSLNLPVSFLSSTGSSISWAADQILRSDIRSGDIVVWGLTSTNRLPYYQDKAVTHVNVSYYQKNPKFNSIIDMSRLDEPHMKYQSVTSIAQVVNFCQKVGAKLWLAGVLVDRHFIKYASYFPNYIQLLGNIGCKESEMFIDLGSDNSHPGPLTHKYYAENIINKINQ